MKIQLNQLVGIAQSLTILSSQRLTTKSSYKVIKNAKVINSELEIYEKARKELCFKYSKKDKDGEPITKNDQYVINDINLFNKEFNELNIEEVELNIELFSIDILDKEGIKISPNELVMLSPIIDDYK